MTIKWREPVHIEYNDNDERDAGRPEAQYDEDDLDDIINEDSPIETAQSVMSEAQARIEQANLYQTIINHELFGPNSARPEIMALVEDEIKTFALGRLEILLGMKQDDQRAAPVAVSQFSDEEVDALKAIASRLSRKPEAQQERSPGLNTIAATPPPPTPAIRQIAAPKLPAPKTVPVAKTPVKQAPQPAKAVAPAKPARKPRTKPAEEPNESKFAPGKDYSQAVNPNNPPQKMPRDIHIDQPRGASAGGMDQFMLGVAAEAIVRNKHEPD